MADGSTQGKSEDDVVAFLGPKASYTHQAAKKHFSTSVYDIVPQPSIEDVFAAVQHKRARHGVVPFENSSNGAVIFTLDLFADLHARHPDILVIAEIYLPVRHCLLAAWPVQAQHNHRTASDDSHRRPNNNLSLSRNNSDLSAASAGGGGGGGAATSGQQTPTQSQPLPARPRVQPRRDLSHITKIYSHPQAWGQCKVFLAAHLKHAEKQDVSSTSRAAEIVAREGVGGGGGGGGSSSSAAVSSKLAAELNGLEVLAEGIEDSEGNSTRFFVLQKRRGSGDDGVGWADEDDDDDEGKGSSKEWKTLLSLKVAHGEAGALADSLAVLKKHGLNLTSMHTRPSGETQWHYIFFLEFVGRRLRGGRGTVNAALRELDGLATGWRWLGSWESAVRSS